MSHLESFHADHGAVFTEIAGERFPVHYGRPDRTHLAVRNGVGAMEMPYSVLEVRGADRVEYVDNVISKRVPDEDAHGCYGLLCDPQGRIVADLYVFSVGERLLLFAPPAVGEDIAAEWQEKIFIQDVEISVTTDDTVVFGVHGPTATEKVASVVAGAPPPDGQLILARGSIAEADVLVIAGDNPCGEESYEIVCDAADAERVFDALLTRGLSAVPMGMESWRTLTLEAGTPLFTSELEGAIPNELGLDAAIDYDKGCFIGQEVVSRIENRGQPGHRLVGLRPDSVPGPGAAVLDGDRSIGEVTRAAVNPTDERPIAMGLLDADVDRDRVSISMDDGAIEATVTGLPFATGSATSARVPRY